MLCLSDNKHLSVFDKNIINIYYYLLANIHCIIKMNNLLLIIHSHV